MIYLRNLVGLVAACSVYSAVGLSAAGAAMLLSPLLNLNPCVAAVGGFLLPIGPLFLWFSTGRATVKRVKMYEQWKKDGIANDKQYRELKAAAIDWHRTRLYGNRPAEVPQPAASPKAAPGRPATDPPPMSDPDAPPPAPAK
jgi:hypothetical protein